MVTMADGSQVWVCKECGTEHQPGEGLPVADATAAQSAVNQATGATMTPPAASTDQPAPSAGGPVDPTQKPTL